MHRYRIVARISLLLSILNLVLAAPIAVQEIHEARNDNKNVAQDVAAAPKKSGESEAAPDKGTDPPSSSDEMESLQDPPSPSGSMSSGYSYDVPLSSDRDPSDSLAKYAWLVDKPWHLRLQPQTSLDESGSPHPSSSGVPEMRIPEWLQDFAVEMPPSPHFPASSLHDSASPHPSSPHPSSPGSPGLAFSAWLAPEEIPPSPPATWRQGLMPPLPHIPSPESSEISLSPQNSGSDRGMSETYSQPDEFSTFSHPGRPSSFSSMDSILWYPGESTSTPGSISPLHHSMSEGLLPPQHLPSDGLAPSQHSESTLDGLASQHPTSDGLVPSQHSTSDGSSPSPSPSSETPPDDAEFFNKNMMKKIGIVAGVATIVGGTIAAGVVGSQKKHHKHRDCQDT